MAVSLPLSRWLLSASLSLGLLSTSLGDNWPAWRGPTGLGICSESGLPVHWSTSENVKWKASLPEGGNSTPIVWGERIFLTQATSKGKNRMTFCFDRANGKLLWQKGLEYLEEEPTHEDNPYCSASPVTDGKHVFVSYGSAGVVSYDLEGNEAWRRDLGKFHHIWGNASSPVLYADFCILNCGPGERSSLLALEKSTGKTAWKLDVPGGQEGGDSKTWTGSWSTPILLREGSREDLVVSFPERLRAFDPQTGKERWSAAGLGRLVYTSPIAGEGVVVAMSGFMGPPLAVRAGGEGDVTETHRLWRLEKAQQRIGSGVIKDGHVYIVNEPGVAEAIELKTGRTVWRERLGSGTWSSVVLAEGNLYAPDQSGDCFLLRASPKFELLAKSSLGELMRASIAVSEGALFLRTYQHLWCIRAKDKAP